MRLSESNRVYRRNSRYVLVGLAFVVAGLLTLHFVADDVSPPAQNPITGSLTDTSSFARDGSRPVSSSQAQTELSNGGLHDSDTATISTSSENSADAGPADVVPIPIPAELAAWFEADPERVAAHERLERETRHPEWAAFLEAGFRDFFNGRFSLANTRILSVECRNLDCEILAIGYGDAAFQTWFEAMGEVFDSGWLQAMPDPPAWEGERPNGLGCWYEELGPGVTALGCMARLGEPEPSELNPSGLTTADFLIAESAVARAENSSRIPVPQDMVKLFQGDTELAQLHLRMERESSDLSWSVYAEGRIVDFLASRPAFESTNILFIDCRTTLCEIQVQISDDASLMLNWMHDFSDFYEQSGVDLEEAGVNGASRANGQIGVILVLKRRSTEAQGQGR